MTWLLRDGRKLVEFGGYGVARELRAMSNAPDVVWVNGNSYVCVRSRVEPDAYRILSINGIGEVRWEVNPDDLGWSGDGGARAAVAYFLEEGEAEPAPVIMTRVECRAWLRSKDAAYVRLSRDLDRIIYVCEPGGGMWEVRALITGAFSVAPSRKGI